MLIVAVKNTSGSAISAGQVVYQTDYLRPQQLPIVALASAAAISTAEVLGICVWDIADNETGPIAVSGDVYPIDTSAFSAINDKVYLSDTPGAISATSGTIPAVIGTVKVVGAAGTINTTGTINLPTFAVSSITPSSGPTVGGTAVTIAGAGFISVTEVSIGGTPCDPATVVTVDANTITAVTPAGSAGAQDVIVTASAGSETLTGGFTYVTAPAVTIISPTSGVTTGGTAVTITGTDFLSAPGVPGASTVTIGGLTCTGIDVISATSIEADTPIGTGVQDVVVTTPYGTGTLAGGFTYVAAPTVISITPNSGNYLGGTSVTIAGTDFLASPGVPGAISVTIGGVSCTGISYPTSSSIIATSPAGTPGVQDVEVVTNYGTGTLVGGFTYTTYSNVYSMEFDGIDDYITTSTAWPELTTATYSVSFWLKGDLSTFANGEHIIGLYAAGSASWPPPDIRFYFRVYIDSFGEKSLLVAEGDAAGGNTWSINTVYIPVFTDNFWHHYAYTSVGTTGGATCLYIDGVLTYTGAGKTLSGSPSQLYLWMGDTTVASAIKGNIDEVAMFDAVLSAAQVTTIYNEGAPPNIGADVSVNANLKHWWRMGDGTGDTASIIYDQEGSWNLDTNPNGAFLSTEVPYVVINSVTPYYGLTSTATAITIAGYNFNDVTGVTIGGAACDPFVRVDENTITTTTPTSFSSGTTEDLVVTTSHGYNTLADAFVYTPSIPAWSNTKSMTFDGTTNAITTLYPNYSFLDPASPAYSVSFWLRAEFLSQPLNRVFLSLSYRKQDGTGSNRMWVRNYNGVLGGIGMLIGEGNGSMLANSTTWGINAYLTGTFVDELWHHYVYTSVGTTGGQTLFYIDGTPRYEGSGKTLVSDPGPLYLQIGSAPNTINYLAEGMDELALFDDVLTPSEVTAIYNNGAPTDLISHSGLKHYYRMGEAIGDTAALIRDQKGHWNLNGIQATPALDTDVPYVVITSITPYYAVAGTASVTIKGYNFNGVNTSTGVTIGGTACTSISITDSETIVVTIPAGSGTQDVVVIASGGTGTLPGGFVYVASIPAWSNTKSMEFDGSTNDIATMYPGPALDTSSPAYSVSFWTKVDLSTFPSGRVLFALDCSSQSLTMTRMYIRGYVPTGALLIAEGNADMTTPSTTWSANTYGTAVLTTDTWHHLAYTSEGVTSGAVVLYIDGISVSTGTGKDLATVPDPVFVRLAIKPASTDRVACNFDEIAIFDDVLTPSEVTAIYNTGTPTDISSHSGIQTYWRMGDAPGDTATLIRDQVGHWDLNGADGTPVLDVDVPVWSDFRSMEFTGSDYISSSSTSGTWLVASGSGYSISFWFRASSVPTSSYKVPITIMCSGASSWAQFRFYIEYKGAAQGAASHGKFAIYEGNASIASSSISATSVNYAFTDTLWHHLVFTSPGDGSSNASYAYVDGVFWSYGTGKALHASPDAVIMRLGASYTGGYDLEGNFDEISLFSAELSAVQVAALYNNGAPTDITSHADLDHWWRMGDEVDTSTNIEDQIGSWDLDTAVGTPVLSTNAPFGKITGVLPYYGLSTGGTAITISGYNFDDVSPSTGVTIGGSACTSVVIGSTTITAVTPAGSAGAQDLVITSGLKSATFTNGFVYVTSVPAWANASSVDFTGASDYLKTGEPWPELAASGSGYSVSFWLKMNTPLSSYEGLISLGCTGGNYTSNRLYVEAKSSRDLYILEGDARILSPTTGGWTALDAITEGWHHYVITSPGDGGTRSLYKDGVLFSTGAGAALHASPDPVKLWMATYEYSTSTDITGFVDEVSIFGSPELSAANVSTLYNAGIPYDISAFSGIQHYWRMGDGIGDTVGATGNIRDQVGSWNMNYPGQSGTYPGLSTDVPYVRIASVSPYYGLTVGSTAITITGSNFVGISGVTINSVACTSVVTVDANTITAVTPAGAGVQDLVVTSTNGFDTLSGGFVYTASIPSWANTYSMDFTGANNYIFTKESKQLDPASPAWSISFWLKMITPVSYEGLMGLKLTSGNLGANRIYVEVRSTGNMAFYQGNASFTSPSYSTITATSILTDANWHHYVYSSPGNGGTSSIYLDGTLFTSGSGEALHSSPDPVTLWLATYPWNPNTDISGNMDEVAMFGIELSSGQVNTIYNGGTPTDISSHTGIQNYWRMGDAIGDLGGSTAIVRDQVGGWNLNESAGSPTLDADVPAWSNASSMVFNGANSIYTSGSWPELSSSNLGYSVAFWAKVDTALTAHNDYLFFLTDSSNKYRLKMVKAGTAYQIWEGNAETTGTFLYSYITSYNLIIDDLWHHYTITSPGNGGTVIVYQDGGRVSSFTGKDLGTNLAATKLMLSSNQHGSSGLTPCNIDEFAIFSSELSAGAVTTLYNDGIPTDLSSHANIQHWWRMGDGTGDTASDIKDQEGSWALDTLYNTPALSTDVPYVGIDSVVPYYAVATGGTTITISGSGFDGVTDVKIGAGSVASFTVVDANTITIVTAAVAAGTYDLEVITSNGSRTQDDGFVYVASIPAWASTSSMVFDGTNALSTTTNWPELSSSNLGYSVAFWAKVDTALTAHNDYLFFLTDSSNKYRLKMVKAGTAYQIWEGNAETTGTFLYSYITSYNLIIDDLWHHYTITSPGNGGTVIVYKDGGRVSSFTGKDLGTNLAATKLMLSSNQYVTGGLTPCNIDEFAIFSSELSAGAVTTLYNNGAPADLSSHASIQHYWRLGDAIGDTASLVRDQVGGWDLNFPYNSPALDVDTPYIIVDSVDPYYDDIAGVTVITITGSNLANVTGVTIGVDACTSVSATASSVTATTPAVSAGVYDLVVSDPYSYGTLVDGFVYRTGSVPAWASTSSMVFDGTNALSTTTNWPELSSSNLGYSVAFWAKVDTALTAHNDYLFFLTDSSNKYRLKMVKAGTAYQIWEGNAETTGTFLYSYITSYNLIIDDLWHHYTITSPGNGGTVIVYKDGGRVSSFTGKDLGTNLAATKLMLSSNQYVTGGLTPCNIDEFAIFSSELSAGAVTTLYNNGAPADLSSHASIQHYWRLGDAIGDTASLVRDQVGGWDLNFPYNSPALDVDTPYIIVDSVDPYYDDIAGVTVITITGSNLANVTGVTIGVDACTSVSATASSVTATTPAVSAGVYDLVVSDPYSYGTLVDGFVYRTGSVPAWSNTYSTFFDGVDDGLFTTTNWPELSSSNLGYSVAFWCKVDSALVGSNDFLFTLTDSSNKYRLKMIKAGSTAGLYQVWEGNAETTGTFLYSYVSTTSILTDDAWHHVAITSEGDGGEFILYIDGASAFTQSTGKDLGTNLAATKLFVAVSYSSGYAPCNIDEFAMFGITLSAAQVTALYNSGTPTDITSHAGIQHYWRMGDAIGDLGGATGIIRDQVGYWNLNFPRGAPVKSTDVP